MNVWIDATSVYICLIIHYYILLTDVSTWGGFSESPGRWGAFGSAHGSMFRTPTSDSGSGGTNFAMFGPPGQLSGPGGELGPAHGYRKFATPFRPGPIASSLQPSGNPNRMLQQQHMQQSYHHFRPPQALHDGSEVNHPPHHQLPSHPLQTMSAHQLQPISTRALQPAPTHSLQPSSRQLQPALTDTISSAPRYHRADENLHETQPSLTSFMTSPPARQPDYSVSMLNVVFNMCLRICVYVCARIANGDNSLALE